MVPRGRSNRRRRQAERDESPDGRRVDEQFAIHSLFMSHTRCAHDTLALPNGNDRVACNRVRVHLDFSRRSRCVLSIWRRRSDLLSRRLLLVQPVTTSVYHVDVKVQKFEVKADASSRDLQDVHTTIVVNFSIDGSKCNEIVKTVGTDFAARIILPAVEEVTKASTALFPVEKVIQERPKLKKEIEDGLKVRLAPYWITVQAVSITTISFSHDFSHAIEQKQVEEQNVQRAEFVRQQAEKEGQRQLALAEGQAKANRLLQESLKSSPEVLQMKALDKWDGKLPAYMGSGSVPFIRLEQGK